MLVFLTASCSKPKNTERPESVKVKTMKVSAYSHVVGKSYIGTIEEEDGANVTFGVLGTVVRVMAEEGQFVRTGQPLAEVDGQTVRSSYEISRSTLEQTEDAYRRIKDLYDKGTLPEIRMVEMESMLTKARAAEAISRKSVDEIVLRAPFDGFVASCNAHVGGGAAIGVTGFRLVKIDRVKVKMSVPEKEIGKIAHEVKNCRFIMSVNPVTLGTMKTPREYGADFAIGEGQPLGLPLAFGGPYLGFMASVDAMKRSLPGRIVGQTVDHNGKTGYVLILQAREQHIRREKASSNICSNQALCALAVGIYLSAMGSEGLKNVANQCYSKAHYMAAELSRAGFEIENDEFFHEFVTSSEKQSSDVLKALDEKGILGGLPLDEKRILWCCTEMNSKADIDQAVAAVKEVK